MALHFRFEFYLQTFHRSSSDPSHGLKVMVYTNKKGSFKRSISFQEYTNRYKGIERCNTLDIQHTSFSLVNFIVVSHVPFELCLNCPKLACVSTTLKGVWLLLNVLIGLVTNGCEFKSLPRRYFLSNFTPYCVH